MKFDDNRIVLEVEGKITPVADLNLLLNSIKEERDRFCRNHNLTPDDLWILLDLHIHRQMLKQCDRETSGLDRTNQRNVMGMHAIYDPVKYIYLVPKKRLHREVDCYATR